MGYETTIFICQAHKSKHRPYYLGIIAAVDMSCLGSQSNFYKHYYALTNKIKSKKRFNTDKYEAPFRLDPCELAWHGSENKYVNTDTYGDPLVSIPAKKALELLEADFKDSKGPNDYPKVGYRRLDLAVAMLNVLVKRFDESDLVVIPWGH
jgi:hypothetical protein